MIEAFFRKKSRIASIKFGPLGKFADGLAEKLVRNGYSTNMSQGILTRFGELSYYLHSRGVAPGMVNSSRVMIRTRMWICPISPTCSFSPVAIARNLFFPLSFLKWRRCAYGNIRKMI